MRQLVLVLRDSDDPRRLPQPPEGGYSGRGQDAGGAGRQGIYAHRAGHDALRHGRRRREPTAAADRGDRRDSRRGMAARAVLLSRARGRAPAGYDEAPAERLRLPRSADAAHQPAYPDRYEPHGHQRAHPRGLPHVQGARHDAAHDADGRLPRRNGGRF